MGKGNGKIEERNKSQRERNRKSETESQRRIGRKEEGKTQRKAQRDEHRKTKTDTKTHDSEAVMDASEHTEKERPVLGDPNIQEYPCKDIVSQTHSPTMGPLT